MLGAAAPYVVSISAMLFAAASALTLFRVVRHLDPPDLHVLQRAHPEGISQRLHPQERVAV